MLELSARAPRRRRDQASGGVARSAGRPVAAPGVPAWSRQLCGFGWRGGGFLRRPAMRGVRSDANTYSSAISPGSGQKPLLKRDPTLSARCRRLELALRHKWGYVP